MGRGHGPIRARQHKKCRVPITCHCTLKKLGKKRQFVCDLVKKSQGGGMFLLSRRWGALARGAMFLLSRGRGGHWLGGGHNHLQWAHSRVCALPLGQWTRQPSPSCFPCPPPKPLSPPNALPGTFGAWVAGKTGPPRPPLWAAHGAVFRNEYFFLFSLKTARRYWRQDSFH